MKGKKSIIVTKRDGTLERFTPAKLVNCLARVMRERSYDPKLAQPLTRAVAMHLREWRGARPPTTNYIHRCVCSVLRQTGLSDVADDLALHRRMRTLRRRRIRVVDPRRGNSQGEAWRKGELVAALQNEFGLRHSVARFLAGQIEVQVFALNYRVIRRAFLAELIRNEVLAWGLADDQVLKQEATMPEPPVASRPSEPEKEKKN